MQRSLLFATILVTSLAAAPVFAQTTATAEQTTTSASSGDLKPLDIKLPKPTFVGTPPNMKVENLEPPSKPREPFMAPAGTTNLAYQKDVSASDEEPVIGEIELVTDGDKEASDGSYVEFGPGLQWVQVDLGQVSEVYAVVVWHFHSQARVYHDVIIRLSDDPDFVSNVTTIFNNDHDNSSKLGLGKDMAYIETNEGKLVDAKGAKARYVRFYSNGNTANEMNHMIEVEVYGRPAAN